jgi:hypothetical protein
MNDICDQMSKLKVSTEIILNTDSWRQDQLDSLGIYKEIVTSGRIYKAYSYGDVFVVAGSQQVRINNIKIQKYGGDTVVIATY